MSSGGKTSKDRPLLGVYTPELSGFYFGELVGQLLTLCRIKKYRVAIINTKSYGRFKSRIQTEAMDMAIVLRNAIHTDLAKELRDAGKRVVSISYDYFPLDIPFVSGDSAAGIDLAISYLVDRGHEKFLFIGNLSNFDIRKRYEAFSEKVEELGLQTWDEEVFQLKDDLVSGGHEAAELYNQKECNATAVICGTALNGIGFDELLDKLRPDLKHIIQTAAFDAISMIPIIDPNIVTVDQNLNLIAYKALAVADGSEGTGLGEHHHTVPPKLISPKSDFMQSEDAYLATSFELSELYNANYMKCILTNISEWSRTIAESKLDNVMALQNLFKRYLNAASISRVVTGKSGSSYMVYTKIIDSGGVKTIELKGAENVASESAFPKMHQGFDTDKFDTYVHIPRCINDKLLGYVSCYGMHEAGDSPCSFTGFSTFLMQVVERMDSDIKTVKVQGREEKTEKKSEEQVGFILWDKEVNEVEWDGSALNILGFVSEMEQNIYNNMELTDRVDEECISVLGEYLLGENPAKLPIKIKLKHKSRQYIFCDILLDGTDENNKVILKLSTSLDEG